jgi:hypothetical protein
MRPMKLFLTWLLGVPMLVTSMVMAQAMFMPDRRQTDSHPNLQRCSDQGNAHDVATLVAKQGYRLTCERLAIH